MAQRSEGPTRAFQAAAALADNRRVKLDSNGKIVYAEATDYDCIGVTVGAAFAAGDWVAVRLLNAAGTQTVTAAGAVALTDTLYAADDGKVAAAGTVKIGKPLAAVTADDDLLEALLVSVVETADELGSVTAESISGADASLDITGKAAAGGAAGSVSVDAGDPSGGTAGAVNIGAANAGAVNIGKASVPANIGGPLTAAVGASTAAAGETYEDAAALPAGTAAVYPTTAADDTKGVIINAADKVSGRVLLVGNGVANKILKVYPPAGGSINGAAANVAFSSASGKGVIAVCLDADANTWLAW